MKLFHLVEGAALDENIKENYDTFVSLLPPLDKVFNEDFFLVRLLPVFVSHDMGMLYDFGDVHSSIDSQTKLLDGEKNSVAVSAHIWLASIVFPKPLYVLSILKTFRGIKKYPRSRPSCE